jgi:hypothetical protein
MIPDNIKIEDVLSRFFNFVSNSNNPIKTGIQNINGIIFSLDIE